MTSAATARLNTPAADVVERPHSENVPPTRGVGKHIVFLQWAGAGHINPTVPLVAAMTARGVRVTYFAASAETVLGRGDPVVDGSPEGELVKGAGAALRNYRFDRALLGEPPFASRDPRDPGRVFAALPPLLEDLAALRPRADVIVYDCMFCLPPIAGRVLGVPTVGVVTNTGPACTAPYETAAWAELYEGPRQFVRDRWGVDLFDCGIPLVSWYSSLLNVVLADEEFFAGFASDAQRRRFGGAPFRCVGTAVDPRAPARPAAADFAPAMERIRAAREAGRKVVLLSLGSAVTGLLWSRLPPGDHGCASGRELAHFVWRAAFGALGGDAGADALVVMAYGAGGEEERLEGLGAPVPENFVAVPVVPQLDVLPLCSAFITHGGMGSVMESIAHGVPMVVVPVMGDQPKNARNVQRLGMGIAFHDLKETLNAQSLGAAMAKLADPQGAYRAAIAATARRMEDAGGAAKAIELIMGVAN